MPVTTRLPIEADLEAENVRRLSDLINQVYDDAEAGMWKRKGTRIGSGEVERLLREPGALLRRELELLRRPRTHHPQLDDPQFRHMRCHHRQSTGMVD
jgi:hypothetical protein